MAKKKKSSEPVEKTDESISKVMEALVLGKELSRRLEGGAGDRRHLIDESESR
jgi:hypothetical protein